MFVKFPKISSFHNVFKDVNGHCQSVIYRAKAKLHGTNAGVTIVNGEVFPQSRSQNITPDKDNMGFAQWVSQNEDFFLNLSEEFEGSILTVFGEWSGPGIMKGTAANLVEDRFFAIFALFLVNPEDHEDITVLHDLDTVEFGELPRAVQIMNWMGDPLSVNLEYQDSVDKFLEIANAMVEVSEQEDQWMREVFGVRGVGEGFVFYPVAIDDSSHAVTIDRDMFSRFVFKAKGEKHKVVKQKKAVQIDPEVAKSIEEYVDNVVTVARLEQAVRETNSGELVFDKRNTGPFLKCIAKDVLAETQDELDAAGLEWSQVQKVVSQRAREWFFFNCDQINV